MGGVINVLKDVFDPGMLVFVLLFTGVTAYATQAFQQDAIAVFLLMEGARSTFELLINVIEEHILEFLLLFIVNAYVFTVLVAWIGKKRVKNPENPFKRGIEKLLGVIGLSLLIVSPFALLAPIWLFAGHIMWVNGIVAILAVIGLIIYLPVVLFSLPAMIIDGKKAGEALEEGALVGRRKWWLFLAYVLAGFLVLYFLFAIASFFLPDFVVLALWNAATVILPAAALSEIYISDTHGE